MSDQCHSTVHGEKAKPGKTQLQALRRSVGTVNGMPVWRSIDELADTPEFREHLEKEFPHGALELQRAVEAGGENRRDFLKIMGGSLALAGIAAIPGCRQPDHKILPYAREVPEDIVIGKPLFYATSMARPDGGAEGLLVETHEGRPTKIEGNPLHPTNNGKASMWALASIMSLYDPDRLKFPIYKNPVKGEVEATWDDFRAWAATHFAGAGSGEGLAFVVGKASSPSLEAAKASVLKKFPKAMWSWYAPTEQYAAVKGAEIAFGKPMRETLKLDKSTVNVIVSLDRDFLYHESEELVNSRGFANTRTVWKSGKGADAETMSRLYVVESGFSITGAQADHRLAIAPSRVTGFAVELAKFILPKLGAAAAKPLADALAAISVPSGDDFSSGNGAKFLAEAAKDLLDAANRDKALVLVGHSQPAEIHALGYAINAALGSVGKAQVFQAMTADEASNANEQFAMLAEKVKSGAIKTLVTVNANPVFDAPGAEFAAAFAKIPATVTLSVGPTETAAASTWALNGAHYLESWGDTRASDGTISPVQPMIAPLYDPAGSRAVLSDIEFLALIAGGDMNAKVDGYEIVRSQWKAAGTVRDFESAWRHALHDGVRAGTARGAEQVTANFASVAAAIAAVKPGAMPSAQSLDVAFVLGHPHDGRYGNIAWLHELPEVATRTVWDNPVLMSPATAEALGVLPYGYSQADPSGMYTKPAYPEAQMVNITVDGKTVAMPAWILPGMANNTLIATFGYGRSVCGRVGDGVGVNVASLRPAKAAAAGLRMASGATVAKANATYPISSTQNHWTMEGRTAIVRAVDLEAWNNHGAATQEVVDTFYGSKSTINFAERLGELSHTPPRLSIYANPYNAADDEPAAGSVFATGQQWAMTIDQTLCTGCGACTLACQSENNIPVVGKKEVAKGREMTWIRVDRYFTGDFANPDAMFHQPVACVHCENAPCEVVCPVNATVHGTEGINYMTYNRCIGTRYCANNCPYKVRRYNFFEYGKLAFNGDYIGKEAVEKVAPERGGVNGSNVHNKININLIPPRLRDKISQIEQMQKNPNVTVRMRGVMEKCSYCIQRINESRIESKLHNLPGVPDGFFQVACQQACPSNAIVFGDMLDTKSKVHATKAHARSYALLGYLNTRPRTSHMVRVMNPNPALCDEARKHSWAEPFHHGDHGGGHGDGHGGGHGDHAPASDGHGEQPKPHAYIDPSKRSQDGGYAMSLKVLGASF